MPKPFKDPIYFRDCVRTEQFGICHKDQLRRGIDYGAIKSFGEMREPYQFAICYDEKDWFLKYEVWYASVIKDRGNKQWYKELKSFKGIEEFMKFTGLKEKIPEEYIKELQTGIKS